MSNNKEVIKRINNHPLLLIFVHLLQHFHVPGTVLTHLFTLLLPLVSMVTGVGAMTWSPLACGIITGKYENGIPESSRASMKVGQKCSLRLCLWRSKHGAHPLCSRHTTRLRVWTQCKTLIKTECHDVQILFNLHSIECSTKTTIFNIQTDKLIVFCCCSCMSVFLIDPDFRDKSVLPELTALCNLVVPNMGVGIPQGVPKIYWGGTRSLQKSPYRVISLVTWVLKVWYS